MKKTFLTLLPFVFLLGCTVPDDRVLQVLGMNEYSNVRLGDEEPCASEEYLGRHFTAETSQHRAVAGIVCCTALEHCTIYY